MKNFFRIDYKYTDSHIFSYRSGLLVYEERFTDGMLIPSGYNAAGYPLDTLQNIPTRLDSSDWQETSAFGIELEFFHRDIPPCVDYTFSIRFQCDAYMKSN